MSGISGMNRMADLLWTLTVPPASLMVYTVMTLFAMFDSLMAFLSRVC